MKIVAISDLHGQLDFSLPEADLLLIAGDLCPAYADRVLSIDMQIKWLNIDFRNWIVEQPVKEVVFTSGNHDWIFELAKESVPKFNSNIHYLEDDSIELMGLKIYGTPVQLEFCAWAFNRTEEQLQKYWDNIPEGLDILLLHSPPYGILDKTRRSQSIGSKNLKERIEKVRPKVVIFGHNHHEYGIVEENGIKYINASLVDERYKMVREPIEVKI